MQRAKHFSVRLPVLAIASLLATAAAPGVSVSAAENPFPALAGTWNGSATAQLEGGKTESLRCKGYYTNGSGGAALGLSIRCANASAKVELRANLNYADGAVSGSWEERTYNQSGSVSGKASASKISLAISGGIEGSLSVSLAGSKHSVSVSTGCFGAEGHQYLDVALRRIIAGQGSGPAPPARRFFACL